MDERIIELEKKLTFQEDTLEQLSQVIIDQDKRIYDLAQKLELLENQMSEERLVKPQEEEEPPPHY